MKPVTSNHISKAHALNMHAAYQYADTLGCPLDLHVTILWSFTSGYPSHGTLEEQCAYALDRTQRVMKGFRDFARYYGLPNHATWVLENPPHEMTNHRNKLVHTHTGFHVPAHLKARFDKLLPEWVFDGLPGPRHGNAICARRHPTQWSVVRYQLKGLCPTDTAAVDGVTVPLGQALGITRDPMKWDQGPIHGKRVGMSKQLDVTARTKAGFLAPALCAKRSDEEAARRAAADEERSAA